MQVQQVGTEPEQDTARAHDPVDAGAAHARADVGSAPTTSRWDDAGMATAEYAVATLAACGFAGLLVAILRGNEVRGLLLAVIRRALSLE